jgi:hypothetical protein
MRGDGLFRQQDFDRLSQELFHPVTEHVRERLIHELDIAALADDHDAGGSGV